MTEEVPVVDNSAAALSEPVNAPDLPLLGTLLVAARERWNLSAADLARQLRLALRQVQALEEDRFDALPGNTFVRGFIRNYARVVQTEPDAFLDAYERSRPQVRQYDIERAFLLQPPATADRFARRADRAAALRRPIHGSGCPERVG